MKTHLRLRADSQIPQVQPAAPVRRLRDLWMPSVPISEAHQALASPSEPSTVAENAVPHAAAESPSRIHRGHTAQGDADPSENDRSS